jgi:hypothetical protein
MLLGILLGAIITLLLFAIAWQRGQKQLLLQQADALTEKLNNANNLLKIFFAREAEREKCQQGLTFNLTDAQVTDMAHRISTRIKTIYEAEQAAALQKMD